MKQLIVFIAFVLLGISLFSAVISFKDTADIITSETKNVITQITED